MPNLQQLSCSIELASSHDKLREHNTTYGDGFVETLVAVPDFPTGFSIHLTSKGYIAPGLAMFVYMDGLYQCNRNKGGCRLGRAAMDQEANDLDFRVRQKETKNRGGTFVAREWRFEKLDIVSADEQSALNPDIQSNIGTIEVVVLRCRDTHDAPPDQISRMASAGGNVARRIYPAENARGPAFLKRSSANLVSIQQAPLAVDTDVGSASKILGLFDGSADNLPTDLGYDGNNDDRGRPYYHDRGPYHDERRSDWTNTYRSASRKLLRPTVDSGSYWRGHSPPCTGGYRTGSYHYGRPPPRENRLSERDFDTRREEYSRSSNYYDGDWQQHSYYGHPQERPHPQRRRDSSPYSRVETLPSSSLESSRRLSNKTTFDELPALSPPSHAPPVVINQYAVYPNPTSGRTHLADATQPTARRAASSPSEVGLDWNRSDVEARRNPARQRYELDFRADDSETGRRVSSHRYQAPNAPFDIQSNRQRRISVCSHHHHPSECQHNLDVHQPQQDNRRGRSNGPGPWAFSGQHSVSNDEEGDSPDLPDRLKCTCSGNSQSKDGGKANGFSASRGGRDNTSSSQQTNAHNSEKRDAAERRGANTANHGEVARNQSGNNHHKQDSSGHDSGHGWRNVKNNAKATGNSSNVQVDNSGKRSDHGNGTGPGDSRKTGSNKQPDWGHNDRSNNGNAKQSSCRLHGDGNQESRSWHGNEAGGNTMNGGGWTSNNQNQDDSGDQSNGNDWNDGPNKEGNDWDGNGTTSQQDNWQNDNKDNNEQANGTWGGADETNEQEDNQNAGWDTTNQPNQQKDESNDNHAWDASNTPNQHDETSPKANEDQHKAHTPTTPHKTAGTSQPLLPTNSPNTRPYWSTWNATPDDLSSPASRAHRHRSEKVFIAPEEPCYKISRDTAERQRVDTQVRPGKGVAYAHSVKSVEYLDSVEKPYAVFRFMYRSRAMLERILGSSVEETEEEYKQRIASMSKDDVIAELLRTRNAAATSSPAADDKTHGARAAWSPSSQRGANGASSTKDDGSKKSGQIQENKRDQKSHHGDSSANRDKGNSWDSGKDVENQGGWDNGGGQRPMDANGW
ncbi:hypothetical protein H2201_000862 [Coniosporium apollinis]|uniref:Uncharacterized protein n=1 Tax=Coniosporium apollinis TaxID=61459 RepID=A0ABQ9P6U2_9PEZI|nr:hypothetical protein H2201_000862 [Coniosporium apollinis]